MLSSGECSECPPGPVVVPAPLLRTHPPNRGQAAGRLGAHNPAELWVHGCVLCGCAQDPGGWSRQGPGTAAKRTKSTTKSTTSVPESESESFLPGRASIRPVGIGRRGQFWAVAEAGGAPGAPVRLMFELVGSRPAAGRPQGVQGNHYLTLYYFTH